MVASDDLKLNKLLKVSEDFFIENHHQFLRNDPIEVLQIAYCHQIFNNIQKYCFKVFLILQSLLIYLLLYWKLS